MPLFKSDALILSVQDYRESSLLLRIQTPERGVVGAIAKGARKPRSRLAALLQPYCLLQTTLSRRNLEGDGLFTITSADLLQRPRFASPGSGDDETLERLAWSGVFAEILTRTHENDPHSGELFVLSSRFFHGLDHSPHPGSFAVQALFALLDTLGYQPNLSLPDANKADKNIWNIDLLDGSLREADDTLAHNCFPLDREALHVLHDLIRPQASEPDKSSGPPTINRRVGRRLARLAIALFESHLEHRLVSVRFLEDIVLGKKL